MITSRDNPTTIKRIPDSILPSLNRISPKIMLGRTNNGRMIHIHEGVDFPGFFFVVDVSSCKARFSYAYIKYLIYA